MKQLFILYLDTEQRRSVLHKTGQKQTTSTLLYGYEAYEEKGWLLRHNLETPKRSTKSVHVRSWMTNKYLKLKGMIGGDFRSVIACRKVISSSDLLFSTSDTIGIPLALFNAKGRIQVPIIYASIGLPERIQKLKSKITKDYYKSVFSKMDAIICYGYQEYRYLENWLKPLNPYLNIQFIPFGVDTDSFSQESPCDLFESDILSIGADPQRDFSLLLALARSEKNLRIEIITNDIHAKKLGNNLPNNLKILRNIPIKELKKRISFSKMIVLPVKDNSYSGATTTLLQCMSMGKPVIVSQVGAIKKGYYLENGKNCFLIRPGDIDELIKVVKEVSVNSVLLDTVGKSARQMVEQRLSWSHYTNKMIELFNRTTKNGDGEKRLVK